MSEKYFSDMVLLIAAPRILACKAERRIYVHRIESLLRCEAGLLPAGIHARKDVQ